jgi:hypothetical protein
MARSDFVHGDQEGYQRAGTRTKVPPAEALEMLEFPGQTRTAAALPDTCGIESPTNGSVRRLDGWMRLTSSERGGSMRSSTRSARTSSPIVAGDRSPRERRTTPSLDDGSTVYTGTVAARLVAPESGFKEGEHIRVFPFGYVAHDEAADPDEPLEVSITVDAGGLIRELAVAWGGSGSAWTYTVTYSDLGATAPIVAPANAQPFPPRTTTAPPTG